MNNSRLKKKVKDLCPCVRRYEFYKKAIIYMDNKNKKYVVKQNNCNILQTYNYLNSRGFGYLPRLAYADDDVYVYEYVNDNPTPKEQKMSDLVKMDALLHNKTVYYKDITLDEIKEVYENLGFKIDNTYSYYDDIITMIEGEMYMSPSNYMLARNCSQIFSCLNFCKRQLDEWYDIMKNKLKKRVVLLHNDLSPEHLIRSDENVLISWDKSVRDLPIYDFIRLYKNNYDKYDFNHLYKEYTKRFPLTKEERKLLFIILFIPPKLDFNSSEMKQTINVSKLCNYLVTTDILFMENEAKNTKEQNDKVYE